MSEDAQDDFRLNLQVGRETTLIGFLVISALMAVLKETMPHMSREEFLRLRKVAIDTLRQGFTEGMNYEEEAFLVGHALRWVEFILPEPPACD